MIEVQHRPAHDVFVTGVGSWTPYGPGWPAVWDALVEGRSAFAPVGVGFGPDPTLLAGRIPDWNAFRAEFPRVRPPLPIPLTRLALVAARRALAAAGLYRDDGDSGDDGNHAAFGVMLNRNRGPAQVVVKIMQPVFAQGPRKTSPLLFSQSVANAPLGAVATTFGLRGPHLLTLGGGAIMTAFDAIRRGDAPGILVGGFEEHVPHLFEADLRNKFIAAVRSPDEIEHGPVMSEGAVCVLLESGASLAARGAKPLARICAVERGIARDTSQGDPLTLWGRPDPQGFSRLARRALGQAGVRVEALQFHAGSRSGVAAFDLAERRLRAALGIEALAERARVGSIKRLLGETMGMGSIANLAWASTMISRSEIPRATVGAGVGADPFGPERTTLMTHLDAHASQLVVVMKEAS